MTRHPQTIDHTVQDPWRAAASRATHPSVCDGGDTLLSSIAEGLAAAAAPWELGGGGAPSDLSVERLLVTDRYDAWIVYWPPGAALDGRHHRGSCGAISVVSGTLDDETPAGDGTVVRTSVVAGTSVDLAGGSFHPIVNHGTTAATSVHVYSPPLSPDGLA